jgi:predicted RNase H-like HicB family nuclease
MKKFLVIFERTKSGFSAYVPDLPGCVATGRTKVKVKQNIYEAVQLHLEGLEEEKIKLPKAAAESEVLVFK